MKRRLVEFGPAFIGDPDFGVADLPEQEIADPHFAGGANQQIGVGRAGRIEMIGDRRFVDVVGDKLAGLRLGWRSMRTASTISARPP